MARRPLTWALLLVVGLVAAWVEVSRGFIDLDVYRFGGAALADGVGLYDGADPATGLPFTYPPFAALLMAPLAQLPPVVLAAGWAAAGVAALLGVLRLLLPDRDPHLVLALTAGCLLLEPVWQSLSFGQVNLFLMLLVAYDVLRPDRRTAGVLIGIAAGIKLTPLVLVALLVLAGRRVPAVRALGAFAATVALGFVAVAGDSASYWTHVLWDPARIGGLSFTSNQSVNGLHLVAPAPRRPRARLGSGRAPRRQRLRVGGPAADRVGGGPAQGCRPRARSSASGRSTSADPNDVNHRRPRASSSGP